MRVSLVCVGRPKSPMAEAIAQYEGRIGHYYSFDVQEVKEGGRRSQPEQVVTEEGERLLARVPKHHELVALHRPGSQWSSDRLSRFFGDGDLRGVGGVTFVIGGAYGLSPTVVARADHLLSISAMTLPHELARLVLVEQIYRAGTIARGEPYHKGPLAG